MKQGFQFICSEVRAGKHLQPIESRDARSFAVIILALLLLVSFPSGALSWTREEFLAVAERTVRELDGQINEKALLDAGRDPVAGVMSCKKFGRSLAREAGAKEGLSVRRVSPKPRNPKNLCDDEEMAVIELFAQAQKSGAPLERVTGELFYAKPVIAGKDCVSCHGQAIDAAVREKILQFYPDDKAFGYSEGDLMGIVVVSPAGASGE